MSAVPKLRFPEFDGEWDHASLSAISDVRDGTHDTPQYVSSGYPLITSKNLLKTGELDLNNVSFISEDDFLSINRRSGVDVGDILFGMIGTIGNPVRVKSNEFAIKNVALIKELERVYLSWLIQFLNSPSIYQQFHFLNSGGTQKFISLGAIRNIKVCHPSLPEQQKIASFLSSVDKKIDLLRQKKDALELYKKGLMQKIFSQEIRFKQDDGSDFPEWEEVALGDIGEISSAGVDKKIVEGEQRIRLLNFLNVYNQNEIYDCDLSQEVTAPERKVLQCNIIRGDIFFTPSSETRDDLGKSAVAMEDMPGVVYSYHVVRFRPIAKIDLEFSRFMFEQQKYRQQCYVLGDGSGQRYVISQGSFRQMRVEIPRQEEQKKIGILLSTFEKKIQKASSQIEQMETFKKGLLQQMFV